MPLHIPGLSLSLCHSTAKRPHTANGTWGVNYMIGRPIEADQHMNWPLLSGTVLVALRLFMDHPGLKAADGNVTGSLGQD